MRQIGTLGLTPLLRNSNLARKAVKQLLCIPLLPADKFKEGVECVIAFLRQNNLGNEFSSLMRYKLFNFFSILCGCI